MLEVIIDVYIYSTTNNHKKIKRPRGVKQQVCVDLRLDFYFRCVPAVIEVIRYGCLLECFTKTPLFGNSYCTEFIRGPEAVLGCVFKRAKYGQEGYP